MVCYNRKIETRIFHAFPQAGSTYWVNNKDPRTTSMTSVFQPSVFFCKNNTRAPDVECMKIWFSSGHGRECCSQRTFFQSRTNLLCWLPNICSWRYLWRIRQESYGTSSEKNSWPPFWQCYNAGTPGETPRCLRINQYICNLLSLLFFLFSSKKLVFWHFSRRARYEICSTIKLKIKTPLASFWPFYC